MSANTACLKCGQPLPADAPGGVCPNCLLGLLGTEIGTSVQPERHGQDAPPSSDARPRFGDYELLEEIARGGMGVVYKARQLSLGRTVALKMILAGQFAGKQIAQRFRGEAAAAATLQHPNIVAVHDVGVQDGRHFFSMDYVEGQNLAQLVGSRPLAPNKAARYVKLIAEAIHYAHGQGILHRDLKPSNVLIDSATDQPRVTDFGLAKRMDGESSLTVTGQLLGSPNFMPPEQASSDRGKVGRHSDVYGLGAILYHLLTARAPFQAESLEGIIKQVYEAEPVPPRLLNASVPRDLETICLQCLEKEPAKRFQTTALLAEELGRFLNDEPIRARPVTATEKLWRWCRRKPALAGSLLVIILLLLIVVVGSPLAAYRINQARKAEATERRRAEAQLYAAEVNLAHEALTEANLTRARQLLDRQRPSPGETNDLRGFEWRYVYGQCRSDERLTLSRSENPMTAACFAPNGQWLAVTDGDGNVKLWDHRIQKEILTLPAYTNATRSGHLAERKALAVSPDAKRLAVGVGSTIALWALDTRQQTAVLNAHTNTVTYLTFSPDGQSLASASLDTTARLWNVAANPPEAVAVLNVGRKAWALAYSDDGVLLALGAFQSIVRLWDVSTATAPRELPPLEGHTSGVAAVTFSPQTHRLASGGGSGVFLWNLGVNFEPTSLRKLRDTHGFVGVIDSLAFAPDGQTLVSAGSDRNLTLWDLSPEGREPVKFMGHEGEVYSVAFSPDGHVVASASYDGAVKLWNVASPWPAAPQMSHSDWVYAVAFSPDSRLLASVAQHPTTNGTLKLWNVADETLVAQCETPPHRLAFSPDGDLLATDGAGTVRLLKVPSLAEVTNFPGSHPSFSPTRTELIYFREGSVHRRNLKTQAEHVWKTGWNEVESGTASPDGRRIAASGGGDLRRIRLWNTGAPEQPLEIGKHADQVSSLSFSPDGQWLASASWDGTNRLWNLADPRQPNVSLAGHNGMAWAAAFSPDSRTLATGGDDSTIRLWHLASFQQAATLRGHTASVTALAFASDGKHLASGSGDGTVRIWRAPSFTEIEAGEKLELRK